jgi:hypothetical protein
LLTALGVLGYSEPEAMLRIQAMRLVRKAPEVENRIEKGELSLTVAAMVQGGFEEGRTICGTHEGISA